MVARGFPGELEQMVLLAIARLGREAYALAIVRELDVVDEHGEPLATPPRR